MKVPQQINSYDCGIYMLILTEIIIQAMQQQSKSVDSLHSLFPPLSESTLILKRLLNVVETAQGSSDDIIVLMCGTNDSFFNNFESVYRENLSRLAKSKL